MCKVSRTLVRSAVGMTDGLKVWVTVKKKNLSYIKKPIKNQTSFILQPLFMNPKTAWILPNSPDLHSELSHWNNLLSSYQSIPHTGPTSHFHALLDTHSSRVRIITQVTRNLQGTVLTSLACDLILSCPRSNLSELFMSHRNHVRFNDGEAVTTD